MFKNTLIFCLVTCLALTAASAQLGTRLRERLAQRRQGSSSMGAAEEMSYGSHALQKLDFWPASTPGSPLVIFVHGGGWKRGDKRDGLGEKGAHFLQLGYAVASLNYRLAPANTVEEEASDVAHATAFLIQRAEKLGFDPARVVLMGHSAGAHLSALVGTDMRYLKAAGLGPKSLRGIVLLDGAAYDVPRQIAEGGNFMHDTYLEVFGTEPTRQKVLSPTLQAAAPNAPSFLIFHVQREDGTIQSNALAVALRKAETHAELHGFEGRGLRGHMEINRDLGSPAYPATAVLDAWLKQTFDR